MSILIMSSIIGAFFFGAVAAEFLDISAWLAPRIVRRAARNFSSPELSARYEEEWLSELAHYDGLKMIKLVKSIALLAGSYRTAAIYRGEYFIGIGIYTSRLRALVPMLIRYVWRGEGPLSATIILEFAFTRLIDENPELTVSRLMDGSGVGHIHVSTDYSWAVAALHRVIKKMPETAAQCCAQPAFERKKIRWRRPECRDQKFRSSGLSITAKQSTFLPILWKKLKGGARRCSPCHPRAPERPAGGIMSPRSWKPPRLPATSAGPGGLLCMSRLPPGWNRSAPGRRFRRRGRASGPAPLGGATAREAGRLNP
nr:hypothetical protein GCM10020092_088180 [Actinoplanes digitatis]